MVKRLIRILLIIVGTFLIIETLALTLVVSFNLGIVATVGIGLVYLLYGIFYERISILTRSSLLKWIKITAFGINVFMLSIILYISVLGKVDTVTYREDAVIVLGAGIKGESITLPLMYRLDKSIEYYKKNPKTIIVVSGGQGYDETITEALAMERYLVSKGIPKNKIIKEERSTSTYENFVLSKKILDNYFKREYKTVFITNDFHIFRAKEISKVAGINGTYIHAQIQWYLVPVTYIREFMAIIKLFIIGK